MEGMAETKVRFDHAFGETERLVWLPDRSERPEKN